MAPLIKSVVIGTAGHIDHGKTALVRALTGVDTDRLPEEKRRGITIDLGFASLETRTEDGTPLRLSFVDVPGHKLFIRNMLAGAGGIDCVMLVISAEEGIKPQTEEHLVICNLLGITRGLTALTKADAVSPARLQEVQLAVRRFLKGSFLSEERAPILTVSAHTGQGLPELLRELTALASHSPVRDPLALPRLPLDRAFVIKGFGTVVTGTLQSGTILRGQTLALEPGARKVRTRGLQMHGREEEQAEAGSRVAVNLAGVDVAEVQRGETLVLPATLPPVDVLDAEITLLPSAPPLKHRSRVHFHAFTSGLLATVSLHRLKPVIAGESALVRLKLSKSVVLIPGDRFVLRQSSPAATVGGGRVLDSQPIVNLPRAKRLEWLESLKDAALAEQLFLRIARRSIAGSSLDSLVSELGIPREAIALLAKPLLAAQRIVPLPGDYLLIAEAAQEASKSILAEVGRAGQRQPPAGLKRSELRGRTRLTEQILDFLIKKLTGEQQLRLEGDLLFLPGAQSQLPPADEKKLASISQVYSAAGLSAPLLQDVATGLAIPLPEMRRLMTLLLRAKTLVKIAPDDLYIHQSALSALHAKVRLLHGQTLDVARFKQLTGLSRKYAIPLLENLDREHITRKQGETRLVL